MLRSTQQNSLSVFQAANLRSRQAAYRRWHRHQSKCYILRTQMGFERIESSRPLPCRGCTHYHGKAYGQTHATRTYLICGFHPYGWSESPPCPDWQAEN